MHQSESGGEDTRGRPAAATAFADDVSRHEPRNLLVLAAHFVVMRIGWIFKTETVVMPVFLDFIGGAGWLRGCLPVLNRFGQGVFPLLGADWLRSRPQKKWAQTVCAVLMGVPFLILALLWRLWGEAGAGWFAPVFLAGYFIFFAATGLSQLAYGTLQGKLIRADRRGRLMSRSGIVASAAAVACAWMWLQAWLERQNGGFDAIFAWTGGCMVLAGILALALREPPDVAARQRKPFSLRQPFRDAARLLRSDWRLRRVVFTALCFSTIFLLFPHFQAWGRMHIAAEKMGRQLMLWVVAQNIAVGIFSSLSGAVADRRGNRIVLRGQLIVAALTPPAALWLTHSEIGPPDAVYWMTFALLGMTPVTTRTLINYTLELTAPDRHPQYISTLTVCQAVPFVLSPLVGSCVDRLGFAAVFGCGSLLLAAGAGLTFLMPEPRFEAEERASSHRVPKTHAGE